MAIFILETGMMYPSVTAAARAVGVDPSNAAKVVRGQRKEAGGYTFTKIAGAEAPTQREISRMLRKQQQTLSPAEQQQRAAHRERSKQRLGMQMISQKKSTRRKAADKSKKAAAEKTRSQRVRRTAEERERIRSAHAALVEANDMIRQAKRGGTGQLAKKDLQSLAEQMGASNQGLFRSGTAAIEQYSKEDLEQLLRRIETIKQQEEKRREQYDVKRAQYFGMKNLQEAAEKHDALDALARAYEKLREVKERSSGKFSYEKLWGETKKDVQDLDADQIQDLADRLDEWLESDREKDQDALDEIMEEWQAEIDGSAEEGDEDEQDGDKRKSIVWS